MYIVFSNIVKIMKSSFYPFQLKILIIVLKIQVFKTVNNILMKFMSILIYRKRRKK